MIKTTLIINSNRVEHPNIIINYNSKNLRGASYCDTTAGGFEVWSCSHPPLQQMPLKPCQLSMPGLMHDPDNKTKIFAIGCFTSDEVV
ncbi:hypothetical protein FQR65_LT02732 [Abscondita terminalis]|nr:hypothetical protein FQR65_LT02732 [Abscondita terminalis]